LYNVRKPANASEDDLTASEKEGLARGLHWLKFGLAYAIEHGTRPSTIGLVLASSPIALMAWYVKIQITGPTHPAKRRTIR
jgi:microsomal epoxide hydrolase